MRFGEPQSQSPSPSRSQGGGVGGFFARSGPLVDMESAQATPSLISTKLCCAGKLCKRANQMCDDNDCDDDLSGNEQPALGGAFRLGEVVMFCPLMHFSHSECLGRTSLHSHARNYITTSCPRCQETSSTLRKRQLALGNAKKKKKHGGDATDGAAKMRERGALRFMLKHMQIVDETGAR